MRKRTVLFISILLLALMACNLTSKSYSPTASPLVGTIVASTLTASAVAPGVPTETATPAPIIPQPEIPPTGGQPAKAEPLAVPDGTATILLMGSDQRPKAGDFRTDTMVLVVLRKDGTVSMVSFPRDLWVYLPGKGMQRINAAQEFGGFDLVKSSFEYNFGFAPESYVLTNFSGFESIVNSLGGIDVQVGKTLADARTGYPDGFRVDPGQVHMDGETALWYVRSRKTTSDLDRLRRSQEVIVAIARKMLSLNGLSRVPEFYAAFRGAVVTDLTLADVTDLAPIFQSINANNVQRYAISSDQVVPFVTGGGADVLLPRSQAIRAVLMQAFGE